MVIFGIGLNKTGTSSLHEKLTEWGLSSYHYTDESMPTARLSELLERGVRPPFNAIVDVPYVMREFRWLARAFPNARFVCTERDVASWIASRKRHLAWLKANRPDDEWASAPIDAAYWEREHREHYRSVEEFFSDKSERLLRINIPAGDDAGALREFLGMNRSLCPKFKRISWPPITTS